MSDFDGFWTLKFNLFGQPRAMTMTIRDSKITGGNSEYYYIGEGKADGKKFTGRMDGIHYHSSPDMALGGLKHIPVTFQATMTDHDSFVGRGEIAGIKTEITFTATRRD